MARQGWAGEKSGHLDILRVMRMVWDSVKLGCLCRQRNFTAASFRLYNEGAMVFR